MTGRGGDQGSRGISSTTGMIIFIAIGAVLTASGTYLMLELGSQDIGQTATTTFETSQEGEKMTISHDTGESVRAENLRVVGATVVSMPDVVGPGNSIEVRPTAKTVTLLYEDGRVSQELISADAEVIRLVVRVEDGSGGSLEGRPVGVYNVATAPTVSSADDIRTAIERGGGLPSPTFVGTTDGNGEFVSITAARDGLDAGGEYVVVTASTGPAGQRVYAVESVAVDDGDNTVRLVLQG